MTKLRLYTIREKIKEAIDREGVVYFYKGKTRRVKVQSNDGGKTISIYLYEAASSEKKFQNVELASKYLYKWGASAYY